MAIIYTYPSTSLKSSDAFLISDGSDNKTYKLNADALLSWIDDNLQYDLQQVLNAGSEADLGTGSWTDIKIWRDKFNVNDYLLYLNPSITASKPSGTLEVYTTLEMKKGLATEANIESPTGETLKITSGKNLGITASEAITHTGESFAGTYSAGFEENVPSGNYSTQVQEGYYKVTTNSGKQMYHSGGDSNNIAFEFKSLSGITTHPYLFLEEDINLWLKCKVTDVLGDVGTNGKILKSNANGYVQWADDEVNSPGGTTNSIQYKNASGDFDGNQFFLYENLTATSSKVVLGSSANHAGDLHLHSDGDNSIQAAINMFDTTGQSLTIKTPLAFSTDYELTLPVDEPQSATSYLVSNTNGEMSWSTAGGGASGINGTVQLSDGSGSFISSTYLNYNDTANTLNVGVGNTSNSPACGLIIGSSESKSGTLGILGPNGGKVQFQAASTGSASVELTFPDTTPNSNQILQSDATGQLSWINTPSAVAAAAGAGGDVQINNGANQMGVAAAGMKLNYDSTKGSLSTQSNIGTNAAYIGSSSSTTSTQSFTEDLGTMNLINNNNTGSGSQYSTVLALKTLMTTTYQANPEFITFYDSSGGTPVGSIVYDPTGQGQIVIPTTSDERLKENKVDYDKADAKTKIKALNVKKYSFIADADKREVKGFFAQEVKEVIPEAVIGSDTDKWDDGSLKPMSLNMHAFIPYLTAALQDAQDTIEKLEEQLTKLEKAVEESNTIASDAKDEADAAKEVANDAKVKAEAADDQAADAAGKAQSAFDKASDAEKAASEADEKAGVADAKAVKAQADATEAKSTAATAKAKADTNETEIAKKADKEEGGE
jgi:hypothetical protein